jgi:hypothetical protein
MEVVLLVLGLFYVAGVLAVLHEAFWPSGGKP